MGIKNCTVEDAWNNLLDNEGGNILFKCPKVDKIIRFGQNL